jgi:hypothetical protein
MVTAKHPALAAVEALWQRCRDVSEGTDAVKARGTLYLPQPSGMDHVAYASSYLVRATFLPVFRKTVSALSGVLLRRPPKVDAPDIIREQLTDVTLQSEALPEVVHDLTHELLTVGRVGVLVDMPTEMEGHTDPSRAYWTAYHAEDITNWHTRRVGNDPAVLVQLVLRERSTTDTLDDPFAHITTERYRECVLDAEGRYKVRVWTPTTAAHLKTASVQHFSAGDWVTPTRRGAPLNFIPFAFLNASGITPTVERPPLLDLADINLAHYRNSSDLEWGLYLVALPTPWASGPIGDAVLKIGPQTAWKLSENGRAGYIEFSGAGLGAISGEMRAKEQIMAGLGGRLLEPPAVGGVTATAVLSRNAAESASLRTIASVMSAGLTTLVRWHAWWTAGVGDIDRTIRVDLDHDLDKLRVGPDEIKAAMLAVQSDLLSFPTFYTLLEQAGWTRPGATAEQEREAIVASLRLLDQRGQDNE